MPSKTFGLTTPTDLYYKLLFDIERLRLGVGSDNVRYAAFDCAVTASHIVDWVLHAIDDRQHQKLTGRTKQQNKIIAGFLTENADRLPPLKFCSEIANSVKHVVVTRGTPMNNISTGSAVKISPGFDARDRETWKDVKFAAYVYIVVDDKKFEVIELFRAMAGQWELFLREEGLFVEGRHDEM